MRHVVVVDHQTDGQVRVTPQSQVNLLTGNLESWRAQNASLLATDQSAGHRPRHSQLPVDCDLRLTSHVLESITRRRPPRRHFIARKISQERKPIIKRPLVTRCNGPLNLRKVIDPTPQSVGVEFVPCGSNGDRLGSHLFGLDPSQWTGRIDRTKKAGGSRIVFTRSPINCFLPVDLLHHITDAASETFNLACKLLRLSTNIQRNFLAATTLQVGTQRVVISRRYGIELMIVAAGTRHRQTEKCFSENIQLIIDDVGFIAQDIRRRMSRFVQIPKSGPNNRFIKLLFWMPPRFRQ